MHILQFCVTSPFSASTGSSLSLNVLNCVKINCRFFLSVYLFTSCCFVLHPVSGATPYWSGLLVSQLVVATLLFMMSAASAVKSFTASGHLAGNKTARLHVHQRKGEQNVALACSRLISTRAVYLYTA